MLLLRRIAGRFCARYYWLRTLGKMHGATFLLRRASLIRVQGRGTVYIGEGTVIDKGARIVATSSLHIGDNVYIGKNSTLIAMAPVTVGNGALMGENVSIHSEDHGPPDARSSYTFAPVHIGSDAWIGAGVVVVKGVTIGNRATIGANAVVTKDVPHDSKAIGVPARVVT